MRKSQEAAERPTPTTVSKTQQEAIFLKGTGLDVLWPQFVALLLLGLALLTLATLRFRREVA